MSELDISPEDQLPDDETDGSFDLVLEEAEQARRAGDLDGALDAYERALQVAPDDTAILMAKAQTHLVAGQARDALHTCIRLLEVDPHHMGARTEMAEALRLMGRSEEAHAIHALLLHDRPDSPYTWCGLARLLEDEGHLAAAETCLRRALALSMAHVPAQTVLAQHLINTDNHEGAIDAYHDAIALEPDNPAHHTGMALSLMALGRLDEARDRIERAIGLDDDYAEARVAKADILTMAGRAAEAQADAAWRWRLPGHARPLADLPAWDGGDLDGARLVLYGETSRTETIRMARLIPQVVARGAHLTLMVHPDLVALMEVQPGVERAIPNDEEPPADLEADCAAALGDLPALLGLEHYDLPQPLAELEAPARRKRPVVVPMDTVMKVGVAWCGSDATPPVPIEELLSLASIPGLVLFGLEFAPDGAKAAAQSDPSLVTDLGPTLSDFADVAGRISQLDVVVAADGPVAHLAGAMNIPVLLMLSFDHHPRWTRSGDQSPWYPTARLFRQHHPGQWRRTVNEVRAALSRMVRAKARDLAEAEAKAQSPIGAQASLLDAHLLADDLLVDATAGDGVLSRLGLIRDSVAILALEANPILADQLSHELNDAHLLRAALGPVGRPILAGDAPRGGRRLHALPPWVAAPHRAIDLSRALAEVPDRGERRLVLRLDPRGHEEDVAAAMGDIRPALICFYHDRGSGFAAWARSQGYRLWRIRDGSVGPAVPFEDEPGAVLALGPGLEPAAEYGNRALLPPLAADIDAAHAEAQSLAEQAAEAEAEGDAERAADCLAQALMTDPFNARANIAKGQTMQRQGRIAAAIACYHRAATRAPGAELALRLAEALRELRHYDEADSALHQARELEPDNPAHIHALALLRRDQGRLEEAASLLEPILDSHPEAGWELSQVRLALGDLPAGLALLDQRPRDTLPAGMPAIELPPPGIPIWTGDDVDGQTILVYQDCDLADAVLLARFIPRLAERGARVVLACQHELVPLLEGREDVAEILAGDDPAPECQVAAGLMDLAPHLARPGYRTPGGYIDLPDHVRPRRFTKDDRLRVGLAWGGRPVGQGCQLSDMLRLATDPSIALVALGGEGTAQDIDAVGAEALIEKVIPEPADMAETAALIAAMDLVVGGDTAEVHLAAAMGKPTFVLVPHAFTWRWTHGRDDCPWYPTVRLFRQSANGSWRNAMKRIARALKIWSAKKQG
jgi:tetratricopeptide (TPR) repeat protein/ADP-heptose:LPS heptosyltransferase